MNRKLLIAIVGSAATLLLIVIGVAIWATMSNVATKDGEQTNEVNANQGVTTKNTNSTSTSSGNEGVDINSSGSTLSGNSLAEASTDEESIIRLAKSFTQRFGSFSNDTDYENIELSRPFMTEDMINRTNALIIPQDDNAEFYSISTQSIDVDIVDFGEGATGATIEVGTRRTERKGLDNPVKFSQTARLELKKISNQWKVDKFTWK